MSKLIINSLVCKNFRCFDDRQFFFNKPIVVISGENGSGKTTLLEAIFLLGSTKSFKTKNIKEVVAFTSEDFFVKADLSLGGSLQFGFSNGKKRIRHNETLVLHYQQLTDIFIPISLHQDDLAIVQESPEMRRSFFDMILCQLYPEMVILLQQYRQTLVKKQNLLFLSNPDHILYEMYSNTLSELTHKIRSYRYSLLDLINQYTGDLLFELSISWKLTCNYSTKNNDQKISFYHEVSQKRVLYGAHLDDINLLINGVLARHYGSRGQQKTIILLLKLIQIFLIKKIKVDPQILFLIDDFLTDFDEKVALHTLSFLFKLNLQIFITSPRNNEFLKNHTAIDDVQQYQL